MKKILFCLVLLAAMAQAHAEKLVVLDIQTAIDESLYAKGIIAELEKEFTGDIDKLKSLEEQITKIRTQLERDAQVLSQSQISKLQGDLEAKALEYQLTGKRFGQEKMLREQELSEPLAPKVKKVLEEIMAEQNIDLIIKSQAVIEAKDSLDITRLLTERLNEQKLKQDKAR